MADACEAEMDQESAVARWIFSGGEKDDGRVDKTVYHDGEDGLSDDDVDLYNDDLGVCLYHAAVVAVAREAVMK